MQHHLPEFLGLGTQKGGTTTLQRLLEQHPQVYLPLSKELQYFTLHYSQGEAWYRQQFKAAAPEQSSGEITPYYLFHPMAPQRIKALLPAVKLIVLLRDPVERTLSQLAHSRRLGLEPLELEQALAAEPMRLRGAEVALASPDGRHKSHQEHSYVARSRYEKQLHEYLKYFPAEQLFIRRSEDLFNQPKRVWQELLRFLNLDDMPLPVEGRQAHVDSGELQQLPAHSLRSLKQHLRQQLSTTYEVLEQQHGLRWSEPSVLSEMKE